MSTATVIARPWISSVRQGALYARQACALAFVTPGDKAFKDHGGRLLVHADHGNFVAMYDLSGRTICSPLQVSGCGQLARLTAAKSYRYSGDATSGPMWYMDHILAMAAQRHCKGWKNAEFDTPVPYPASAAVPTLYYPSHSVETLWEDKVFRSQCVQAYLDAVKRDRHFLVDSAGEIVDIYPDGDFMVIAIKSGTSFHHLVEVPKHSHVLVAIGQQVREGQRVARLAPLAINYKRLPKDRQAAVDRMAILMGKTSGFEILRQEAKAFVTLLSLAMDGECYLPHYLCGEVLHDTPVWDLTRSKNAFVGDQNAFLFPPLPLPFGTVAISVGSIHADLTPV